MMHKCIIIHVYDLKWKRDSGIGSILLLNLLSY